ncbi:hypothetical protein, partial [Arsenophonus sp.]|uniref:hypothetical protein n=1 Tax=Arsenophonus sp. TaxID=1872640 RepID=UPI0038794705
GIRWKNTLFDEVLSDNKPNKPILSPFSHNRWLLLLTLSAIQFPNHEQTEFTDKRNVDIPH